MQTLTPSRRTIQGPLAPIAPSPCPSPEAPHQHVAWMECLACPQQNSTEWDRNFVNALHREKVTALWGKSPVVCRLLRQFNSTDRQISGATLIIHPNACMTLQFVLASLVMVLPRPSAQRSTEIPFAHSPDPSGWNRAFSSVKCLTSYAMTVWIEPWTRSPRTLNSLRSCFSSRTDIKMNGGPIL
jgi:hypothetical protein